jgi:hypothetical protein
MAAGRERVSRAWRDLHEAVYHAADATGCAQYIQLGNIQARQNSAAADIESLRCMRSAGKITGSEVARYRKLSANYSTLMFVPIGHPDTEPEAEDAQAFASEAGELEATIWEVVPDEALPGGMRDAVVDPETGVIRMVRRSRRGADATQGAQAAQ